MYKKINSQASLSTVVTLAEAKTQCRVTHTMEDSYITALITVAAELAQTYSNRLLTLGSVTTVIEYPASQIQLPFGEVTAITALSLDGTASTDYTFSPVTQKVTITAPDTYVSAEITYNCGYSVLPSAVKQAVLMMISTLYNNRQDIVTGVTVEQIPLTSRMLLDTVRYYGI